MHLDSSGQVRVIELGPDYARIVNRAFDKIRQSSQGMPAAAIRLLEGLIRVVGYTRSDQQRHVLALQADRIWRAAVADIAEPDDLAVVRARYLPLRAALDKAGLPAPADAATAP